MNYGAIAVLLVLHAFYVLAKNQYCSLCRDHTLCKYEPQRTGPKCEEVGDGGVTEEEKKIIIDLHNQYRAQIAAGNEGRGKGGPQPKGANLMKLSWDNELANAAQRWADQCRIEHDTCRKVPRFKVGQNIYWHWRKPIIPTTNWTKAVESWYEEVSLFNPNFVSKYQFQSATGHYTQLIWHDTYLVGCGRRSYGPNKIYVCNYGPTGNWINDPIYEVGEPCSRCPNGSTCEQNLCVGKPESNFLPNQAPPPSLRPPSPPVYVPQQQTRPNNQPPLTGMQLIHRILQRPSKNQFISYWSGPYKKGQSSSNNLIDDAPAKTYDRS